MASVSRTCLEWASARSVAHGQEESGDGLCVREFDDHTLVAVLDGLGHGTAAARVTRLGLDAVERAQSPDLPALARSCHERLRGTRGLVMSLAVFDAGHDTMTWLGIGNVAGALWPSATGAPATLLLRSGVVGTTLPKLQTAALPVANGDTLILATDGIGREIDRRLAHGPSVQQIADRVLRECGTGADDALVLVARYRRGRT